MEEEFNLIKETRLIEKIKSENSINSKHELAKYYGLFETHYEKGIKILEDTINEIDLNRNWYDYFCGRYNYYQTERKVNYICIMETLGLIYYEYGLKEKAIECWINTERKFKNDCSYILKRTDNICYSISRYFIITIKKYIANYYLINNEIDKMKEFLLNDILNDNYYYASLLLGKYYIESKTDINYGILLLNNKEFIDIYEYLGIYYYGLEKYAISFVYLDKVVSCSVYSAYNWKASLYLGKFYINVKNDYENAYKYYIKAMNSLILLRYHNNEMYLLKIKYIYPEQKQNIEENIELINRLVSQLLSIDRLEKLKKNE
uniref:Tetratricopeptide repeat protein n=1 Tax=viral metagenome TaxID=1070528 RepID=A0A6C0H682_9ZZZZ